MIETIWNWIMENYPGIFAMLVVAYAVWHIRGWYSAFDARVKACEAHEPAIEEIKTDVKSLQQNISGIKSDINETRIDVAFLRGIIESNKPGAHHPPVQAHSPLEPNETGRKIIRDLKLVEMIARNADKIMGYLNVNIGSRNPYDIQKYCVETASVELDKLLSTEDIDTIKLYAFNHGLPLFYYGSLIGVLVRDLYFERNGINPQEVDKHDPNQ